MQIVPGVSYSNVCFPVSDSILSAHRQVEDPSQPVQVILNVTFSIVAIVIDMDATSDETTHLQGVWIIVIGLCSYMCYFT